jgi:hypothetical protein
MPRRLGSSFPLGALLCALTPGLAHCGASSSSPADFGSPGTPGGTLGGGNSGGDDAGGFGVDDTGLPPEKHVESSYRAPVATGRYVWIANPDSGHVAYVDASTLSVSIANAGDGPTYVAAVPSADKDIALVLNVRSDDATMLTAAGGAISTTRFATHHGANRWAVSADGKTAIAWTDATQVAMADPTDGFQDLTVIDLGGAHPPQVLSVGYRPQSVGYSSDGKRAWAVTQDGVSLVDLAAASGAAVVANVPLSAKPATDPTPSQVLVDAAAHLAIARVDGSHVLTLVDLGSGTRTPITLNGAVTDVSFAANGTALIAVVRETATVAWIALPYVANPASGDADAGSASDAGVSADGGATSGAGGDAAAANDGASDGGGAAGASVTALPTVTFTGDIYGSVMTTPTGTRALLYSSVSTDARLAELALDGSLEHHDVRLYAPVLGVFPTTAVDFAVVLHQTPPAPSTELGAYSLLPVAGDLPAKIVGTPGPINGVAITPEGDRAIVSERGDAQAIYAMHLARMPSLQTDRFALASPPTAVGIVGTARKGWVAQEHPEGRITFVDLDSGAVRTLTGFELGARVVDGSTP